MDQRPYGANVRFGSKADISRVGLAHSPPGEDRALQRGQGAYRVSTPKQCERVLEAARGDVSPHIYPFTVIAL